VNNNLVQVSDWLTNILLGATLTQFANVPHALWAFGQGYGRTEIGSPSVAVFLLIHFVVAGFLAGYLCTRVVLHATLQRAADAVREISKGHLPAQVPVSSASPADEPNPPPKRQPASTDDAVDEVDTAQDSADD
jgi:hypothetical protein